MGTTPLLLLTFSNPLSLAGGLSCSPGGSSNNSDGAKYISWSRKANFYYVLFFYISIIIGQYEITFTVSVSAIWKSMPPSPQGQECWFFFSSQWWWRKTQPFFNCFSTLSGSWEHICIWALLQFHKRAGAFQDPFMSLGKIKCAIAEKSLQLNSCWRFLVPIVRMWISSLRMRFREEK